MGSCCQTIHLVTGNHDSSKIVKKALALNLFASASYYTRLKLPVLGIKLILCHYPIQFWQNGFIHLHGHTHGSLVEIPGRKDVGVDANSFSPVSEGLIREIRLPHEPDGRH